MTAFEILLNAFYDTIEKNEPSSTNSHRGNSAGELNEVIRNFINTSFFNGSNLSYKGMLDELIVKGAGLLRNADHEEWARVKFVFLQNDLHTIRKDRNLDDVKQLKLHLEQMF
jgi:hypothetical protein